MRSDSAPISLPPPFWYNSAMKRVSVPILFLTVLLLLSVAFARQLGEKEYGKDANVNDAEYHVDQWGRGGYGGGPGWGRGGYGGGPGWGRGGYGGGPGWSRGGYGGGPGWGRGGYGGGPGWGGCRYRCYYGRCCSAAEFAEFVQSQGIPQN